MNLSKILTLVAVGALALMAFAGTASATTLETNGVKQSGSVTLQATLKGSTTLSSTAGAFANTCLASTVKGATSTTTGATVSGNVSSLSFSNCVPHGPPVVNSAGSLSVERIGETTNGTVRSTGANVTVPVTVFGSIVEVTCTTNNTDIGTLIGTASGTSSTHITINAVLSCSGLLPTAKWTGTYVITGHAIGVVA
jgi:hypothetical protein